MNLQFKKHRSAGTAAQQSSKCSLLALRPLLAAILMLSAVFCKGQSDTSSGYLKLAYGSSGLIASEKDSTWYVPRVDTIKTDFVIIVDSNDFVKKVRCDFIIHKYEEQQHSGYGLWVNSFFTNRNDTFFVKNKPVEVLLYRPKGEQMLVGNSR